MSKQEQLKKRVYEFNNANIDIGKKYTVDHLYKYTPKYHIQGN